MFPRLEKFFADPRPGLPAVYVFGSHARGSTHAESDIDVAILLDPSHFGSRVERANEASRVATALMEATHENAVDAIVLNDAPPALSSTWQTFANMLITCERSAHGRQSATAHHGPDAP